MNDFFKNFNSNPFHQFLGLSLAEHSRDYVRLRLYKNETTPLWNWRQCQWRRARYDARYGGELLRSLRTLNPDLSLRAQPI
ncbi:MAG: hypothetical protein ACJ0RQ_12970 [Candidatus Azotimanducaceae bacterium]